MSARLAAVVAVAAAPALLALSGAGFAGAAVGAQDGGGQEGAVPDFAREILPLLAENCFECHGNEKQEAGLRFDRREIATGDLGGYAAIVPGDLDASELWFRITTEHEDDRMPPPEHGPRLAAGERDLLRRWIEGGAPWATHWALTPVVVPAVPQPQDAAWAKGDLDRFLRAAMEEAGVEPAPEAEPAVLLRRVHYALTGLPPSEADVRAFLADPRPDAYERAVDRLLDSPHYAEHWARHWMDLVRYAETRGHEFDFRIPNAFEYRDYLVRAFAADLPYDQLVREHVAGDLLAEPRLDPLSGADESVVGTAFWFLGDAVHSPVDLRRDQADRTANRLDVLSKTFLGLTLSCARCHDHKFDPIPTTDYYALAGVVQSGSFRQVRFDARPADRRVRAALEALEARGAQFVLEDWQRRIEVSLDEAPAYRAAATEARQRHAARQQVFEDFEGEDYGAWMPGGTAFGKRPRTTADLADYQGEVGAHGKGFVNSHDTRNGEDSRRGDLHLGELWSPEFVVEHDSLSFLVGGGAHAGKTCVQLRIDGKAVLEATGAERNRMEPAEFDLRPFRGATARIVVVDRANGSWGNVGCDYFVFEDRPEEVVAAVAAERGLDAGRLMAWFRGEPRDFGLPTVGLPVSAPDDLRVRGRIVEDWRVDGRSPLLQDGSMFVWRAAGEPLLGADPGRPVLAVAEIGAVYADPRFGGQRDAPGTQLEDTSLNWKPWGRMLRTREFLPEDGRLHYLVRGVGTAFASPAGYVTHHGALHRELPLRFDTGGEWQWLAHDLSSCAGIPLHVEFSPEDVAAPDLAVAMVWEGEAPALQRGADGRHASAARQPEFWLPLPAAAPAAADVLGAAARLLDERVLVSRRAPAMLEGNGLDERLMLRGDSTRLAEPVPRRFLSALGGMPFDGADTDATAPLAGSGRAALAAALTDPANPLVARVYANRVWHYLWGRGLVDTTDNFGVLGRVPDRPELLDHLAAELIADGWSTKRLVRRIVTSRAWRASSVPLPASAEVDPRDRLFHHMPLRRLEAEAVRDALLAASGALDRTVGGPSVPLHVTSFHTGRSVPSESGPLDGANRRSIYQEIRRNALPPLLLVFDFPAPATTIGQRTSSNVPAQWLALMNGPLAHLSAERWAAALLARTDLADDRARVEAAYLQAFGRPPGAHEQALAAEFLAAGPDRGRAWSDYCHALFQVKEFVHVR